jgi:thioester reductase-like protein
MPRPGFDTVYLITGYPGFVARKLLVHVLAAEPRSFVYLVVLPKFVPDAAAALEAMGGAPRGRVAVLEGDAAAMDLGLSGREFRQITSEVDLIHHLAHASYVGVERKAAEQLNTIGAAEIVELAKAAASLRCLVFYSTALVAGDRRGRVYEDELDKGQGFRNVVEETRMRGELIVHKAMRDVPIAVVRPSILVGDSGTGETDRFDGPYLMVLILMTTPPEVALPLLGRGDTPLHLVPADFVVAAAHAIGNDPRACGKTFHLVDPSPLPARRVFEILAKTLGRRAPSGSIPAKLARAILRAPGLERFVRSPRAFVEQLTSDVSYDARNTESILQETGIRCPPFETYVDQIVIRVQEHLKARKKTPEDEPEPSADALD